jgi:hypothetical protein
MGGQNYIVDFDNSDFSGVDLSETKFSAGLLSFNSKGQPFNNGSSLTTETALMVLNDNVVIMMVPGTGRCYIQD